MEREHTKETKKSCGTRCNEDFNDCVEHSHLTCMNEFDQCVSSCQEE